MGIFWGKPKTKQQFRQRKYTGLYQYFDPRTGKLKEEGKFENGVEVGLWKEYDLDGDQIHYQYIKKRSGGICKDGTKTKATGRGAGSHHGGVKEWIYQNRMQKVGGTGKYMSIEKKVDVLKQKAKQKLGLRTEGFYLDQQLLIHLLNLTDKNDSLQKDQKDLEMYVEKSLDSIKSMSSQIQSLSRIVNQKYQKMEDCLQNQRKKLQLTNRQIEISIDKIQRPSSIDQSSILKSIPLIENRADVMQKKDIETEIEDFYDCDSYLQIKQLVEGIKQC